MEACQDVNIVMVARTIFSAIINRSMDGTTQSPTNRTTTTLLVIVVILILIIGALTGYIFLGKDKTPHPSPALSPTPVVSSAPSSAAASTPTPKATTVCNPANLKGTVQLSPGAGNVFGTITLTNTSTTSCEIPGNHFAQLAYDKTTAKNIVIVYQGITSTSPFVLSPNESVYATLHYPNGPQCQSGVNPVNVSLAYSISPGNAITIANTGGDIPLVINACISPSEMTQVQVGSFSTQKAP